MKKSANQKRLTDLLSVEQVMGIEHIYNGYKIRINKGFYEMRVNFRVNLNRFLIKFSSTEKALK